MTKRVFAVAAHPDDIEFGMAGTLFLLKQAGCDIHYMNIANGCCGSLDTDAATTAALRLTEAQQAAAQLEANFYPPLCNDMEIFYNKELLSQLSAMMRRVQPDIVLTHATVDYMEDHVNAGRLAVSAAFTRGMPNYQTLPQEDPCYGSCTIYHAQPHGNRDQHGQIHMPDFAINIDSVIEQKSAMLAAHKSQKEWLDKSQGMDAYLDTMRGLSKECADLVGGACYAEGWKRHSHLGFCELGCDPLAELLRPQILVNELQGALN